MNQVIAISAEQAVKLVDPTANFFVWSDGPGGWVKGSGWETKITYSQERAWQLATEVVAVKLGKVAA